MIAASIIALLFTTSAYAQTSSDNRTPGHIGLGLGLHLIQSPLPLLSVAGTYNVSRELQIEARYGSGETSGGDITGAYYEEKLELAFGSLKARYFLGNSFYIAGGLGHRTLKVESMDLFAYPSRRYNFSNRATTLEFSLGNIWTLDNGLTIGGEWVSISSPVAGTTQASGSIMGNAAARDQGLERGIRQGKDSISHEPVVGFATFVLGYQF